MPFTIKVLLILIIPISILFSQDQSQSLPLNSANGLIPVNVKTSVVTLEGKVGLRVEKEDIPEKEYFPTMVLIEESNFTNGTIELELAGEPAQDSPENSRGFVGIAFRIDTAITGSYECIYLRPVNGRADDQLQRNHSVQYVSHPEYPWYRLRKEQPGVYESYVDLLPGEWVKIKIVVKDLRTELYVHGNSQPTLIVKDLKKGKREGLVGLWLHTSTLAHFRNLVITALDE